MKKTLSLILAAVMIASAVAAFTSSAADASLTLWFDHSFTKVDQNDFTPTGLGTYTVKMAKNEIENCQFFLASTVAHNGITVEVSDFVGEFIIPKYSYPIELSIKRKLFEADKCVANTYGVKQAVNNVFYRAAGGGYFLLIKTEKSITYIDNVLEDVKAEKSIPIKPEINNATVAAVLSSSLF